MVAPLLMAPLIAGSSLSGVYSVGKAVETSRYWTEYQRNTGRSPRYPFRAGRYDYVRDAGRILGYAGLARGFSYGYHPPRMSNSLQSMYR